MKNSLIITFLVYVCSYATAQEYICLKDGSVSRNKPTTFSERIIEMTEKGIMATYKFNYATRQTDTLFPSASVLYLEGFGIPEGSGKPALPHKLDRFAISNNDSYKIVITDSSYIELPMEIAPSRPPIANSSNGFHSKKNVSAVNPYKGYYPKNVITSIFNPYRSSGILEVHITPIQYDYHSQKVRILKNLTYLIEFNKTAGIDASLKVSAPETDLLLSNIVMNPREKSEKLLDSTARSSCVQVSTPGYLIITTPKYMEAVNKFADWKRTLGFNVRISSQNSWDEDDVKDTVMSINSSIPLNYLLIVGDDYDVPGKECSDTIITSDGPGYYNYLTDYYYGCINQNTYPEIRRGRLPVSSVKNARVVVDKIIQYEREPITDTLFYRTGLNCAYFQDRDELDGNGVIEKPKDSIEDVRFTLTSENIKDYLENKIGKTVNRVYTAEDDVTPKYWNNGQYGFYGTKIPIPNELLRSNNYLWNGGSQDISSYINAGAFYVFHRDHGTSLQWWKPSFTTGNANNLNNGKKLPIVFSMNCLTGRYNSGTCLAETFLRKENGGCVAIFAASETSFSGYNDALSIGMFDALWPSQGYFKSFPHGYNVNLSSIPIYRLGDILDIGLSEVPNLYDYYSDSVLKHTKEIFHCFGDPAMEMYTATPTPFAGLSVTKHNNLINITLQDSAKITFYNTSTGLIESFYGTSVTYPYSANVRICVSSHNKIPIIIEGVTLFIQNEEISESIDYEADEIKVGASVTNLKSSGDVMITNGTTKLKGNTVELYEGTTVEAGAQLEITN